MLEYAHDESEETEAPKNVVDDTNRGKCIEEDIVVDGGAVECVTSLQHVPHLKVEEKLESTRGETWRCAKEKRSTREAKSRSIWMTGPDVSKRDVIQIESVSRTLLILAQKSSAHCQCEREGETTPLRESKGLFILSMWRTSQDRGVPRILGGRGKMLE